MSHCPSRARLACQQPGAPAGTHMQRCCRRDLQHLAAEVEALREQIGDAADRCPEGPTASDDSRPCAGAPAHNAQGAGAAGHPASEEDALDEPRAGPDARALARRLAALEGALGDLAAAQERAHVQVSAGLACVTQQLDSLQVRPLSQAAMRHAAPCSLTASQPMLAANPYSGTACMSAVTMTCLAFTLV